MADQLGSPIDWRGHDREYIGSRGKMDVARVTLAYDGWFTYDADGAIIHGPVPLLTMAQDYAQRNV